MELGGASPSRRDIFMSYQIPILIPAVDSLFDRYKYYREYRGWLFYISNMRHDPRIVVLTPTEMASRGRKEHLIEVPITNDEQFVAWVRAFIDLNKL